ncbi:MAG: hypothetical protein ACLS9P_03785 [Haemophilus parainfluenzae]
MKWQPFDRAGFAAIDVHMSDLMVSRYNKRLQCDGGCGGFSYGDVGRWRLGDHFINPNYAINSANSS